MPSPDALAEMIRDADRIMVFSGAGISTESGVPDFRSPGGVWSRMKPIEFDDFITNEDSRREAWTRAFSGVAGWTGREPNDGHRAVAYLAYLGKVCGIITQNVDGLHQDAGAPDDLVVELHGAAGYATCLDCGLRHELDDLKAPFLERGEIPACRACGGIVKSATISFGQPMPAQPMARAREAALDCDLCLVLGSSLRVYPAASFPLLAVRNGAKLAIVNREATPLDPLADLVLHDEIGPLMSEITRLI